MVAAGDEQGTAAQQTGKAISEVGFQAVAHLHRVGKALGGGADFQFGGDELQTGGRLHQLEIRT